MKPRLILALLYLIGSLAQAQTASYYLPPGVTNIRAMVIGGVPNPGNPSADWQTFCATNRVGLAQLSSDLPAIATTTSHPEIAHAPLVLTGNSAASEGAVATAIASPANVVAIIGTHGAMLAIGNDGFNVNRIADSPDIFTINAAAVAGIPQVHTFDNGDPFVSPVILQGWVQYGRSLGAPWHFLIHNDGSHTDSATALNTEILPWLTAILDLRLPASAGTGDGTVTLIPIVEANGWLGDIKTKTIASFASYAGVKAQANWFPNQSVATAWAGYHFAPTYTIPAQPVIAPSGIIANLTVLDPNNNDTTSGKGWRINSNFKEADDLYNDIKWYANGAPPASIAGLDWIRPIIPGLVHVQYTADPIATFQVTADADVFIAHSDAIAVKPAWMQGFTDTGDNLLVSAGNMTLTTTMSIFKKTFTANSTVTLGANGANGGAFYLTFVKPLGVSALPSVSVSATTPNATEGSTTGQFTVTRTGATTNAVTVNFSVGGTAASGVRYVALGTSVVVPAGQSSATVTVTTINDTIQQPTQTVVLTLAAAAAYNLGTPASATVNILDDDTPALPVVSVLASNPNASEPNIPGAFQFTRTGATTSALTVNFTLSGTASVGVDYTNPGTSVVIPAGQTTATLAITPIDNTIVDGTRTVTLSLSTSANYTLGTTTVDTVNIADNDTSSLPVVTIVATKPNAAEPNVNGEFTVTRTGATTSALTVSFALTGTATRAVDYSVSGGNSVTILAGQSSAKITVTVIDDTIVEPTETVICTLTVSANYTLGSPSSDTVNIADNDGTALPTVTIAATNPNAAEPSTTGTFTVTRTGATTSALAVNYAISGTAVNGTDYQTLSGNVTVAAGQTTATITVTPIDNSIVDGTRTVILTLSANAAYTVGSPSSATVSIADNDGTALPSVTIVATNPNAAEPSTTGTFTVTRTGATTGALTVNYAISGTATNGTDYQTLSGSVSIAAGQTSATITVTPIDDTLVEGTETVIATLSANAAYTVGSPASATVNIADNDTGSKLPVITLSSSDSTAAETSSGNPNTGSVTVTRTGATTGALTVQLAYSGTAVNGTDYVTMPASVTIAANQTTATLTLTPIDNSLVDGTRTAVISATTNAAYTLGSPAFTAILINDNDNAAPITTTGIVFATHGTGTNTRDVKLNVYLPATGSGPWPTVIYFPGGGWSVQGENSVTQLMLNLTASGYAVVSANYITSSFARWPAQIQDTKAAVRWVRANAATYGFDPARIAVTGGSSGAHMAAYTAVTGGLKTARVGSTVVDLVGNIGGNFNQSDVVQACAPFFPPTDILAMDHYATPGVADHDAANSPESGLVGAAIQTVPELAGTVNPIIHVRAGLPPFWITNGTADTLVDFNQSELLNAALVKAGQPVTFWPVQGGGHGPGVSDSPEVAGLLKSFLDRTLMGATSNALPIPTFTASTLTGIAPLTVTFDGSASTAPAGVITKYSWSNGDDTGAGTATMTYTYTHAGVYPVTLCVRDDKGGSASVMQNVIVSPAGTASATPPTISITSPADGAWYARTGDLSLQTTTAANGSATISSVEFFLNSQPVAWDSKPPYIATFGHLAPGAYTVTARVSDSTGAATLSAPVSFHVFGEADVFPTPSLNAGQFGASYYRFTDGTLAYTFERSDDLATWTPFTPTQAILTNGAQIQLMQATDPLSASGIPRRFLRIKIAPGS